jgi:hypothetical protein
MLNSMKTEAVPVIYSFIIRFVVELPQEDGSQPAYRGSVRHIQSSEEMNFNAWPEAVEFMSRFVPIQAVDQKPDPLE